MKRVLCAVFAAAVAIPALADVGVSVSVGQPGFYGRIDIGGLPPPRLLYAQPIVVQPVAPGVVMPAPIYLRVPPGHAKHWRKHCAKYNACGQPVYFVQESWGRDHYRRDGYDRDDRGGRPVPQDNPGRGRGRGHGHGRD